MRWLRPSAPRSHLCTCISPGGFGGLALPAEEAFDLPISFDNGDFCGAEVCCEVSARRGPGLSPAIIELTTRICDDDPCRAFIPVLNGTCRIPALPVGDYRVRMNGHDAYQLTLPLWRSETEDELCFTPAPPSSEELICPWQTSVLPTPAELCAPHQVGTGVSATVTLVEQCGDCFERAAGCTVTQEGDVLTLQPRTQACDCPTCFRGEVCNRVEVSCQLPLLSPGTYTLLSGSLAARLEVIRDLFVTPPSPIGCVALNPPG